MLTPRRRVFTFLIVGLVVGVPLVLVCAQTQVYQRQQILFDSGQNGPMEIYVIDPVGANQRRLTKTAGGTESRGPSWSPDRRNIAFASNRGGRWELYVMNADGFHARQLTRAPREGVDNGNNPDWSPDGKRITFDSNLSGKQEIYVIDSDGVRWSSPETL